MAFNKRIWLPHEVQYPGRKILLPTGNPNEFDESRSEGIVTAVGDLTSAENLNDLEKRIFDQFGITPEITSGTWVPTIYGYTTPGTPVYTAHTGSYYKIGKLVIVSFNLSISSKGGAAGIALIGGLPFPASFGFMPFANVHGISLSAGSILTNGYIAGTRSDIQYATTTGMVSADMSVLSDSFAMSTGMGFYITT